MKHEVSGVRGFSFSYGSLFITNPDVSRLTIHVLQKYRMLIYNVTLKIDWPIHDAWVKWMKEKHIPDVMSSGCFTENRLVRVLEIDEDDGPTYASQYHANTHDDYKRYIEDFAPAMQKDLLDNFGNKVIAFRSLMEVVN